MKAIIHTNPKNVRVLKEGLTPNNTSNLKSFLGGRNFYQKCIPHYSHVACPLNQINNKKSLT
jgi:hypothetical protein